MSVVAISDRPFPVYYGAAYQGIETCAVIRSQSEEDGTGVHVIRVW